MYLNIVNNLSLANKRNKSIIPLRKEDESTEDNNNTEITFTGYEVLYNSIFYGQLTQNWLKVTN